jgi:hypothetical protein
MDGVPGTDLTGTDATGTDATGPDATGADAKTSDAAVAAYLARLRRWRIVYAAAIVAVVVAAVVIVKIAYVHGEISHASLQTVPSAAPSLPVAEPSGTLTRAWSSTDHTAIGVPYSGGTVITYSTHTVAGRDARTGAVRWSYTRTDRTVCTAAQLADVTIAVYRLNGNCDQLTALASGTGQRRWTRTLDENGHPVDGTPQFAVGSDTFMVTTPQQIYAISPDGTAGSDNGGLDRWIFSQSGCTINSAVLGTAGVLISQTCTTPDCAGLKFCGAGTQLLLRDPITGTDDNVDKDNPNRIEWNLIGNTMTPVSADGVISAVNAAGTTLTTLDVKHGKKIAALPLPGSQDAGTPAAAITAAQVGKDELIHLGGITYAIDAGAKKIRWHRVTAALPVADQVPGAGSLRLSAPTSGGIVQLDSSDGRVRGSFDVTPPDAGSQVYPLGAGFLVAGPRTVVYR